MIDKIVMQDVASYKASTCLDTDKKVNIIYGLNGSGKSIFSKFLYDRTHEDFKSCSVNGMTNEKVLVYSKEFINEIFYESESIPGIFTLSKENKTAVQKINNAEDIIEEVSDKKDSELSKKEDLEDELSNKKQNIEKQVWEIKSEFTGGDRVLEFCLEGLMGSKQKLFEHISQIEKPEENPEETIKDLKREVKEIKGDQGEHINKIPKVNFTGSDIEKNKLFGKEIVGNENSSVAGLITELDNSDWVQKGLKYVPEENDDQNSTCPFCQNETISKELIHQIKNYFDESYISDKDEIEQNSSFYKKSVGQIQNKEEYLKNYFVKKRKDEFENKYAQLKTLFSGNINKIKNKIDNLSSVITLTNSSKQIKELNTLIDEINSEVDSHNERIANKEEALRNIKTIFWQKMRCNYDKILSGYENFVNRKETEISNLDNEINNKTNKIREQQVIIKEQQKRTVNIQGSINSINNSLTNLGINDFFIQKHEDDYYKLVRNEETDGSFRTLSEGEKMIISFLYFLELCKGKSSASEGKQEKIVVIDDPISSLSHIYVFNIGRLIKNYFFRSDSFEQVFVLTHSLYFFYELTDINHDRRKENQNLFRLRKNSEGSKILPMKYEEIQNDYQAYWQVIKDKNQAPALIANCMRNVIDYFFNFLEKRDFNNVFQKEELQKNKYQAFSRYMNRESHSLGQNIFDYKEFDYEIFKEAFRLVFVESGYPDHYKRMIK
jgi:wobble nucleotide-excising tRNase